MSSESGNSDRDPAARSDTVRCRCGFIVPIEADDQGPTAYCPSCGERVFLPEDSPSTSPASNRESPRVSSDVAHASSDSEHHTGPSSDADRARDRSGVAVFADAGPESCSEEVVDHLPCLCGQEVPVRLADFDGHVYCPSCGAELPVARRLTRFRARPETDAEPARETSVSQPPRPPQPPRQARSGWRTFLVVVIPLAVLGTGAFLNWNDREPIGRTFRKTFFGDERPPRSSRTPPLPPQTSFHLDAVTPVAIKALSEHGDPFVALTLAVHWRREIAAAQGPDDDGRLLLLRAVTGEIISRHSAAMQVMIDDLPNSDVPKTAMETGQQWLRTLLVTDAAAGSPLVPRLKQVLSRLDERLHPITLEDIERLQPSANPEQTLVQARLWEAALTARQTPNGDLRMTRLAEIIAQIAEQLAPVARPTSQPVADCEALLEQLAQQLRNDEWGSAEQTARSVRTLLAEHPEELERFARRLSLLESRIEQLRQSAQTVDQLIAGFDRSKTLADAGRVTDALHMQSRVRFVALTTPVSRMSAERLESAMRELAPALRRATGLRAVDDAIRLNEIGDIRSRNREVRRALEQLSEFPASEVGDALQNLDRWREDALMHTGESLEEVADSDLARRIDHRDRIESMFNLYAEGKVNELFAAATAVLDAATPDLDNTHDDDRFLIECLLHVLERQTVTELRRIDPQDGDHRKRVLQAASEKLQTLNRWDHLSHWQALHELLQSFDHSTNRE